MFKFIREDSGVGVVCAVGRGQVFVAPLTPAPNQSCAAGCGSCGGCASAMEGYTGKFRAPVKNSEEFKVGARVIFNRFIPEPGITSMLVFGLPVAFAIIVMFLLPANIPAASESPAAALCVAAAFLCGFAILGILDKLFRKKYPVTLAIDSGAADI